MAEIEPADSRSFMLAIVRKDIGSGQIKEVRKFIEEEENRAFDYETILR